MNKKGFVVSAILYPLLILFLALLMGLLSMNSTRKNILDNMKLEISDSIFDSVTCDCEVINNTLKIYSQHFNTVDEEIEALKTEISNLKTEASNHASTTTTDLLNSKITALTTRVSNLETRVTTLESYKPIPLKVGDYVYMTPASVSYTIAAEDTGCTSTSYCGGYTDQTINPNELTLWRVIRVNADGTYDVVSVYASSTEVEFYGKTGYQKLVGTLNKIAAQYTDNKYVVKTRMMGYNGQTEEITTALTKANSGTSTTSSSTTAAKEAKGSGDTWYTTDTELVESVFGTLAANKVGTTTATFYWLASRSYYYDGNTPMYFWEGRYVLYGGSIGEGILYSYDYDGVWRSRRHGYCVRPVITLKSTLLGSGSGTSSSPYVLK